MADYRVDLGISLNKGDLAKVKTTINNLENSKKINLEINRKKIDSQLNSIRKQIQNLSNIKINLGGNESNSLSLNTDSLNKSLEDVANSIREIKASLGTLDSKSGLKDLVTSINQIANALGKAEDESDSLIKSLSILSKKDFGFNLSLKSGNTNNPVKAMTDYGKAARRNAIPALQEQSVALQNLLGGYQQAEAALARYLLKVYKGNGVEMHSNLVEDMSNSKSLSKQMEAIERYIGYLRKIASEKGIDLSGFDAQFSKSASEIIDDTHKIQTGAKQTEEQLKQMGNELKNVFGSGIDAEKLSAQLDSIVADLNQINDAFTNLSKSVSLDGITASFDRLSDSIESLLVNAQKIKGVLNSDFDNNIVGRNVNSAKISTSTRGRTMSQNESYLDSYLKYWNIKKSDIETVKGKFETFSKVSSRGVGDELYESSLDDLINTIKQLGSVSKQADKDMESLLVDLKKYNIDAPKDIYGAEFGDNWKSEIQKHKSILANKNSVTRSSVDVAYEELKGEYPFLFPEDIWNPQEQLKKIFEVYDLAKENSKKRKVGISEFYSDADLKAEVLDITNTLQERSRLENEAIQSSNKSTNITANNEAKKRQEYEETKQKIVEADNIIEKCQNNISKIGRNESGLSFEDASEKIQQYQKIIDTVLQKRAELESKLKTFESTNKSYTNEYDKISRDTSLVRDKVNFQDTFKNSNQAAQKAKEHFRDLLAEEKAVVTVTEQFDDSNALQSFTVNVKRATGEVESLRYAMSSVDGNDNFVYQGGSVNDKNVLKQLEKHEKKANDLQIKLDEIKSNYEDMGNTKPIKDSGHIESLNKQYEKVQKAIIDVKNADDSAFSSMVSNAETEKAVLESMVREYRNAETVATSLRPKDLSTSKVTYDKDLDVLTSKMRKDGVYTSGFEKGISNLRSMLSNVSNPQELVAFLNGLDKITAGYKAAKAAKDEFNRAENVASAVSGLKSEIEILQNASPSIKSFKTEINGAEVSVKSLLDELSQVKTKGEFDVVKNRFDAFGKAAEAAGIDLNEVGTKFEKLKSITKEIASLKIDIFKLDDKGDIAEATAQLGKLEDEASQLRAEFQQGFPTTSLEEIDNIAKKGEDALAKLKAQFAKGIKADLDVGNFDNEVSSVIEKYSKLSNVNSELEDKVRNVELALKALEKAAGTEDEVADVEKLKQAYQEYETAIQQANNALKIQARAEKAVNAQEKLSQDRASLKLDMQNWLKNNTKAAKDYGEQIKKLISLCDQLDDVGVANTRRSFKNITKEAELAGKTGLNAWSQFVEKVKKYSIYLSAADIFMYISRGLRDMFEQVKAIDTAMVELRKVTDETDATYNNFLKNAASRAKEIGTTIDGLVTSTADFARLGYEFEDAQGLAEVANIYAVVGDEIESVENASQSLISTMAAFKDEMNGMSDSDFALSIVDKFNEVSNNFSISSGGIGEALTRSASSLAAANNTLDESIALITAANTVVNLCHAA